MKTCKELATAVREDQMGFQEALLMHLEHRHPDHFGVEPFFVLSMAISYVNMGRPEVCLEMAGERATAGEWVAVWAGAICRLNDDRSVNCHCPPLGPLESRRKQERSTGESCNGSRKNDS